jgi:hypothetical protein
MGFSISSERVFRISEEMRAINDVLKEQRKTRLRELYILEQVQYDLSGFVTVYLNGSILSI